MALYEDIHNADIIERVKHRMAPHGPFKIIHAPNTPRHGLIGMDRMIPITSPWVYTKHPFGMRDDQNFDILFNFFARFLGQPPIRCQGCWKIVVRPRNVSQLLQLHGLQVMLSDKLYGCKLGTEIRPNVNALYGGYFYTRSIEEGREVHAMIKKEVESRIGVIPVFLKRGCTEMELAFGDPDKWFIREGQAEAEKYILSHFDFPEEEAPQPEAVQLHIKRRWIEFACENGDETYLQFVDKPFHATYKHYEKGENGCQNGESSAQKQGQKSVLNAGGLKKWDKTSKKKNVRKRIAGLK